MSVDLSSEFMVCLRCGGLTTPLAADTRRFNQGKCACGGALAPEDGQQEVRLFKDGQDVTATLFEGG